METVLTTLLEIEAVFPNYYGQNCYKACSCVNGSCFDNINDTSSLSIFLGKKESCETNSSIPLIIIIVCSVLGFIIILTIILVFAVEKKTICLILWLNNYLIHRS